MARYAVINNGVVINVIEAAGDFTLPPYTLVESSDAGVGDSWNGSVFTRAKPAVPDAISRRQFYTALALNDIITKDAALYALGGVIPDALAAIIDNIPNETDRFIARGLLIGASNFERNHPLVASVGAAQGMTTQQIDDFFTFGATL